MQPKIKVYIAGICSLLLTIGIARFAYTPLLPIMLEQTTLTLTWGGWLAAFNYTGYLLGALIAARLRNLQSKDRLYRLYLIIGIGSTLVMAWTQNPWLWTLSRFVAGVAASGGMLLASALVLNWLMRNNHRGELGIHFMGVGIGISLVSIAVMIMLKFDFNWAQQWQVFTAIAAVLAVVAWGWMPYPDTPAQTTSKNTTTVLTDHPPSAKLQRLLLIAYFFAGIGYVVSITFIVDIVEKMPALQGQGPLAFLLLGLGAAPAVLVWDRLARRFGYFSALMLAYIAQVVAIVLPLQGSLLAVVVGALVFGATFIGCVSLVLTLSGKFYPTSPARLMGKMTLSYGVAQIIGPAVTGPLTEATGNYAWSLYMAATCVAIGAVINARLIPLEKHEAALK